MKFIVDEMPDWGHDCPFFRLGWCYHRAPFDTGYSVCPIFNEHGYEKMGTTKDMCYCLKKLEVCEDNGSTT